MWTSEHAADLLRAGYAVRDVKAPHGWWVLEPETEEWVGAVQEHADLLETVTQRCPVCGGDPRMLCQRCRAKEKTS